jgi:cobalt/nickel transport system permease protein
MHIPDGYLSPVTAGTLYAMVLPFWYAAGRHVQSVFRSRTLPVMALMSAFCFVIQMLNIPLPGGTTGHAVGASLAAIILGVWPAVISVSVALAIQSLFFGDGGVTAFGANCLNMAVAQVFVTYGVYRILPGNRTVAAGVAAYAGVNTAALLTAVQLGIQPLIASTPDGTPLYAPYPLSVTLPAMMVGHLFAGFAEAFVTAAGLSYVRRNMPAILHDSSLNQAGSEPEIQGLRKAWLLIALLVFITPLGLLAPGTAWGEWSADHFREIGLGFVPQGMKKWESFWSSIFPDYTVPGIGENTGYLLSAIAGVAIIIVIYLLANFLFKRSRSIPPFQSQDAG